MLYVVLMILQTRDLVKGPDPCEKLHTTFKLEIVKLVDVESPIVVETLANWMASEVATILYKDYI